MCKEVRRIIQRVNIRNVEIRIALHCAPVITRIKPSNLLIIPSEDEEAVRILLRHSGIAFYRLTHSKGKTVYFLFRRSLLEKVLEDSRVRDMLIGFGYTEYSLGSVLRFFQTRYRQFTEAGAEFPDEIGLLLGYPPEDVCGFIQNHGENYLLSGPWKVYEEPEQKELLFRKYEEAQKNVIQLLVEEKIPLPAIMEIYHEEPVLKAAG